MKNIKLIKKSDLIVTACVLLVALLLLIPSLLKKDRLTATIYVDGEIYENIDLGTVTQSYTLTPKDGTEITVENGKIRFSSAVCKDKICVNCGWLDANGQTAACLPQKIVISIRGSGSAPDMLTY